MDEIEEVDLNLVENVGQDRVSVPLVMLEGNFECLLENQVPCTSIQLRYHEKMRGVILMVGGQEAFREEWDKVGFRTSTVQKKEEQ